MRVVIFTETFLPKLDGIVSVVCLLLDHLVEHGVRLGQEPAAGTGGSAVRQLSPPLRVGAVALPHEAELIRVVPAGEARVGRCAGRPHTSSTA